MAKIILLLLCGVVFIDAAAVGEPPVDTPLTPEVDDCVEKGSLECIQLELYRSMKSFVDKKQVDLFGGFSLVKDEGSEGRSAKSLGVQTTTEELKDKQTTMETHVVERVVKFLQGRSLQWNPSSLLDAVTSTVSDVADWLPQGVNKYITQAITEGRGRKKNLKNLLPLLIGVKLKLGTAMVLAALGVAFLAKKALLASVISIAISLFFIIKKLLYHHHYPHHAVVEPWGHHSGWASPVYGGGYNSGLGSYGGSSGGWDAGTSYSVSGDSYGSHSSPVAHTVAYSGQKPKSR